MENTESLPGYSLHFFVSQGLLFGFSTFMCGTSMTGLARAISA
jgi:hypothetical protein